LHFYANTIFVDRTIAVIVFAITNLYTRNARNFFVSDANAIIPRYFAATNKFTVRFFNRTLPRPVARIMAFVLTVAVSVLVKTITDKAGLAFWRTLFAALTSTTNQTNYCNYCD
jgi:hypothetical protein